MKKLSGALLSLATLAAVLFIVLKESKQPSPGPLSPVHEREADLKGEDGCDQCHGEDARPGPGTCNRCHEAIAAELSSRRGLHGSLPAGTAEACGTCHLEHHGAEVAQVSPRSFQLAGYPEVDRYDHAHLDFPLTGRHEKLACEKCHPVAGRPLLEKGQKRYLGLSPRCASCHEDPHEGKFGPACADCHGQSSAFRDAPGFHHPKEFPLEKGHANVACARCHAPEGPTSIAVLSASPGSSIRGCAACHDDPHSATAGSAESALFLPAAGRCDDCHTTDAFKGAKYGPEEHARIGAPLEGRHAEAACADCHRPDLLPNRPDPAAAIADCSRCHDNPHPTGKDGAVVFARAECGSCHTPGGFAAATVTSADHASFGPALPGPHARLACADCHASGAGSPRWGGGEPPADLATCVTCHESPHTPDFFARLDAESASGAGTTCAGCHLAEDASFSRPPARLTPAQHEAAGFALTPPHDRVECARCHDAAPLAAVPGSKAPPDPGFAARYPGRKADDCAACHGDPHRGEFADGPFAAASCTTCHRTTEFAPSLFSPELHAKAEFPLPGAHAAVACSKCHPTGDAGRLEIGRFRETPTGCAECHEDPHGAAFDRPGLPRTVEGKTGCERCHDTTRFTNRRLGAFDHGFWTGSPLLGPHAKAECRDCHRPPADAPERTFGPAPQRCDRCHEDPHLGQFARSGATDCARCHREEGPDFRTLRFDHGRDSRFPLDGRHAKLSCDACHRPESTRSGRVVIRYRPLGTRCADCHLPKPGGGRPR